MSRLHLMRDARDRALVRPKYCRGERQRFQETATADARDQRLLRKLVEDERRAQVDLNWTEQSLTAST